MRLGQFCRCYSFFIYENLDSLKGGSMIKNGDRVHIISDGDRINTQVLDKNGNQIPLAYAVSWEHEVGQLPTATLKLNCPDLDLWAKVVRIETKPYPDWIDDQIVKRLIRMIHEYQAAKGQI
jgi:hypothetical protein